MNHFFKFRGGYKPFLKIVRGVQSILTNLGPIFILFVTFYEKFLHKKGVQMIGENDRVGGVWMRS